MVRWIPLFLRLKSCTLLELLLAIAILGVMTVLASQILNSASTLIHQGILKMNRDDCARRVFDRMSLDFKAALRRSDIDYFFQKENGNDQIAFYSEASGFYPPGITGLKPRSTVSLIGYRIDNNGLKRLSKALVWNGVTNSTPSTSDLNENGASMVFSPVTISTNWNLTASEVDPDDPMLSSQVFRFEFCFLTKEGAFSGQFDPANSTAVVVTLALVTKCNFPAGFNLTEFAQTLSDGNDPGVADQWTEEVSTMTAMHQGHAAGIGIYQRIFQLGALP